MKRSFSAMPLIALGLGLVGCIGSIDDTASNSDLDTSSEALRTSRLPGYVVVGDSVDYGIGATPGNSYTEQFNMWLEDNHFKGKHDNDFLNLAVPGATSQQILDGQTDLAVAFREDHPKQNVISVGSGGNDLLGFMQSPAFYPCATGNQAGCQANLGAALAEYADNLDETLSRLSTTAKKDKALLVARTQYTGFIQPSCSVNGAIDKDGNVWLPAANIRALIPLTFLALEGAVQDPTVTNDPFPGLNDIMRQKAAEYGAIVVDTMFPFLAAIQSGQAIISRDCVHPNDAGHDLIADLVVEAFSAATEKDKKH